MMRLGLSRCAEVDEVALDPVRSVVVVLTWIPYVPGLADGSVEGGTVLAGLSALDSGPIRFVVGLTILGGLQVLERSKLAAQSVTPRSPEPMSA